MASPVRASCFLPVAAALLFCSQLLADDVLQGRSSWQRYDASKMAQMLRVSLDELGMVPTEMDRMTEEFLAAIEKQDTDPLDAFVEVTRTLVPVVDELASQSSSKRCDGGRDRRPKYAPLRCP